MKRIRLAWNIVNVGFDVIVTGIKREFAKKDIVWVLASSYIKICGIIGEMKY